MRNMNVTKATEAAEHTSIPPEPGQLQQSTQEAATCSASNSVGHGLTANANEMNERLRARENEASSRRVACNQCRGRKVRCDRVYPACGRCSKMGHSCIYAAPSAPHITKLDLARLLQSLHTRLGPLCPILAGATFGSGEVLMLLTSE